MLSNMLRFPFSTFDDDIENLFYPEIVQKTKQYSRSFFPSINIGTTDKSVDLYLFIPGIKADDLELIIEKNMLSVSGERTLPDETSENKTNYRQERFKGPFKRVITLPDTVDTEQAEAVYKDGVLHISIAKQVKTQPRKININVQ